VSATSLISASAASATTYGVTATSAASVINRGGDAPSLRVVDVLAGNDPEVFDVLVVEPA